jgi:hypothetical protein
MTIEGHGLSRHEVHTLVVRIRDGQTNKVYYKSLCEKEEQQQ